MACQHKFYSYLQLQRLTDFEPEIIIIGTFNPELPKDNYSEWFYGRTDNNYFWDLLPKMFGDEGLRNRAHTDWKKYCKRKKIALTDLLSGINDADFTNEAHIKVLSKYTDSDLATRFKDQIPNQVIPLLALSGGTPFEVFRNEWTEENIKILKDKAKAAHNERININQKLACDSCSNKI